MTKFLWKVQLFRYFLLALQLGISWICYILRTLRNPRATCMIILYVWCVCGIVQADQSGTVVEILGEDGKPVSVDTVSLLLFYTHHSFIFNS